MKNNVKETSLLEKYEIKTNWREKAQWHRDNHRWIMYSSYIALQVSHRIDELGMTQKQLAQTLGCSAQYVSKLLKGSENLTLETISKLEECLDIDLVASALTYVSRNRADINSQLRYVAEPEPPAYGNKDE